MKHRFIIHHGHAGAVAVYSGPFASRTTAETALIETLKAGKIGIIQEEWSGRCDRCHEDILVPPGYYQHGCGEVYTFSRTL